MACDPLVVPFDPFDVQFDPFDNDLHFLLSLADEVSDGANALYIWATSAEPIDERATPDTPSRPDRKRSTRRDSLALHKMLEFRQPDAPADTATRCSCCWMVTLLKVDHQVFFV